MNISEDLKTKIEKIISENEVVVFMKGDKYLPRCGFSAKVVEILKKLDVDFVSFDILEDEDLRQGLKVYSDWPTFPQLYLKKELIGGSDIVGEMYESGELIELFS